MRALRRDRLFAKRRGLLVHAIAMLVTAALTAFHGALLWQRVLDQSLLRPVPAVRWLATIALLVGLYRLHRRGVTLLRGRGALVFWLLVLLLHASFWGPLGEPESTHEGWTGFEWMLALPAIGITLGIALADLGRRLARLFRSAEKRDLPLVARASVHRFETPTSGYLPALACRPPPAR